MNFIDKLLPVVGVAFGWTLSELGKYSAFRKSNQNKLRKLLFNLLELRWLLDREIGLERDMNFYSVKLKDKLLRELGLDSEKDSDEFEQVFNSFKPILIEILKEKVVEPDRIKNIEQNIDNTVLELSEIYPVFAYELSGQFRIKEKLEKAEAYFDQVKSFTADAPFNLKEWLQPKISVELLEELEKLIIRIARKIGRKTRKEVLKKINDSKIDNEEGIDFFLSEYIEKMKNSG